MMTMEEGWFSARGEAAKSSADQVLGCGAPALSETVVHFSKTKHWVRTG